jgi:hypothetical protein
MDTLLTPFAFCRFVFGGVIIKASIRRDHTGRATEFGLVRLDRWNQQLRVMGTLIINFIVGDNLVFRLLDFHHLAEFIGLARLPLTNDLRRRLEQAEDLALGARLATENARLGK